MSSILNIMYAFRFVQEYLMSIADSSKKAVNYVNICMGIESFLSH